MTDAENTSVFGPHFHKVFNNNISINWPMLDKINQIDVMEELDHPITCYETKKVSTKLENDKIPGINDIPPNVFKALNDINIF